MEKVWDLESWKRFAEGDTVEGVTGHAAPVLEYVYHKYARALDDCRIISRDQIFKLCSYIRLYPPMRAVQYTVSCSPYDFYRKETGLMDLAAELNRRMHEIFWSDRL